MKLKQHYNKALDAILLILYCSFIYWLSAQSSLPTPLSFPYQDKVMHFGAYFILAGFSARAFRHIPLSLIGWLLSSLIFSSLYGASDEWHQSFVVGRSADIYDWLADTTGAAICLFSIYLIQQRIIQNYQLTSSPP